MSKEKTRNVGPVVYRVSKLSSYLESETAQFENLDDWKIILFQLVA